MQQLIRIAGIKLGKIKKDLKIGKNLTEKKVMPAHTEATVTPNVRQTFESVFSDQMRKEEVDNKSGKGKKRKIKCGMCDQPMSSTSITSSDDATGRKKTVKELRKIREKHEEKSLRLSDFYPTKGRKARTKLKETAYKDTHVGIVGAKNNRTVRKDSIYDAKGVLIQV